MLSDSSISGWNFDNSYAKLPESFCIKVNPSSVSKPNLVIVNRKLAADLGLEISENSEKELAQIFSGNILPKGADPIAQAYAGHQYGYFTILGDGRAHLIGEHITPQDERFDIQFKGSGKTPYAKRGDGLAALGPMLREYIISEAMHALNIPTTRSLAVVTSGEPVMRETILQAAVLTRIASSHIRIGSFEYIADRGDRDGLKILADYTINRHFPEIKNAEEPYIIFLKAVMRKQIDLVVNWLRVGFIHGVMNTDNASIYGETIDYGPCAFMDVYDPKTVFSSIDLNGRYAYANQPHITQWNLARLAEAMLPLLDENIEKATEIANELIESYGPLLQKSWLEMMRNKLGMFLELEGDGALIGDFLKFMQRNRADYTNSFRDLISKTIPNGEIYETQEFQAWWQRWQDRLNKNDKPLEFSFSLMRANNPAFIPRNHIVEEALQAAETDSDFSKLHELLEVISNPYEEQEKYNEFSQPPEPSEHVYQTFCGT